MIDTAWLEEALTGDDAGTEVVAIALGATAAELAAAAGRVGVAADPAHAEKMSTADTAIPAAVHIRCSFTVITPQSLVSNGLRT